MIFDVLFIMNVNPYNNSKTKTISFWNANSFQNYTNEGKNQKKHII